MLYRYCWHIDPSKQRTEPNGIVQRNKSTVMRCAGAGKEYGPAAVLL